MSWITAWMLVVSGFVVSVGTPIVGPVRINVIVPESAAPRGSCLVGTGPVSSIVGVRREGGNAWLEVLFKEGIPVGTHRFNLAPAPRGVMFPKTEPRTARSGVRIDTTRFGFHVKGWHYQLEGAAQVAESHVVARGDARRTYVRGARPSGSAVELWIDEFEASDEVRVTIVATGPSRAGQRVVLHVAPDGDLQSDSPAPSVLWSRNDESLSAKDVLDATVRGPSLHTDGRWPGVMATGLHEGPRHVMTSGSRGSLVLIDTDELLDGTSPRRLRLEIRPCPGSSLAIALVPTWRPKTSDAPLRDRALVVEMVERTTTRDTNWFSDPMGGHGVARKDRGDFRMPSGTWSRHEWDVPLGLAWDSMQRGDGALWRRATLAAEHQVGSTLHAIHGLNLKHGNADDRGDVEVGHHVITGASLLAHLRDDPWMLKRIEESQRRALPHLERVAVPGCRGQDVAWALAALSESHAARVPGAESVLKRLLLQVCQTSSARGHLLIEPARRPGWFRIPPWHDAGLLLPTLALAGHTARDVKAPMIARRAADALVAALRHVDHLPSSLIVDERGTVMSLGGETHAEEAALGFLGLLSLDVHPGDGWRLEAMAEPKFSRFQGGALARVRLGLVWLTPRRLRTCSGRRKGERVRRRSLVASDLRCPNVA